MTQNRTSDCDSRNIKKTNYNLSSLIMEHRKTTTCTDGNPDPGLGQAKQKCGCVELVNEIPILLLCIIE